MRRVTFAALSLSALLLAACGDDSDDSANTTADAGTTATTETSETESTAGSTDATGTTGDGETAAGSDAAACAEGLTLEDGVLTAATGNPAFPPYVIDDEPESGDGFEAAVVYAVAEEMGFDHDSVTWVRTNFDEAIQPGVKNFDINLQQYSITPERAENVAFSDPYYTTNQAIVGFDDSDVVGATSIDDLKGLKIGVQSGTTSLGFVNDVIAPDDDPFIYDDNAAAKSALEANQIDAIVVDLPTAFFVTAVEIEGSTIIGQFADDAGGETDEFGMVMDLDSELVDCVNLALDALRESGELDAITEEWMTGFADAPVIAVDPSS